jgi:NADPH:quinone reductase
MRLNMISFSAAGSLMTLPIQMNATVLNGFGTPAVLVPQMRPLPVPGPGEVLIKVSHAGVNRPDVLQRQGGYPPPPGAPVDIAGLEVSGEVVALGEGALRWSIGDTVCALLPGGGYAEYAVAHHSNVLPIPNGMSLLDAAALPETYFTVWTNVFERGALQPGETLLVHGGTSGIGTTAIQLAKAFGAMVIATAGSPEKCTACLKLGADFAIDYRLEDFVERTRAATNGRGADVILDMVGGDYIPRNHEAAAQDGRIVQIAFLRGTRVELDFRKLMIKRLTHTGSTLRPRSVAQKAAIAAQLEARVWPLLAQGQCRPVIHAVFPLAEAAKAHELMETSAHIGKIMLEI